MERNHSIDVAKGFLILLVILGHVVQGVLEDHFLRYFIYSFHMALFFFVSGYLISPARLGERTFASLFSHYGKRMLGWWLLAWVIFTPFGLYDDLTLKNLVGYIITPYYHLWYVPTLFFFILITYLLYRICSSVRVVCLALVCLGIATYISGFFVSIGWPGLFRLPMILYFSLGVYCSNTAPKLLIKPNGGGMVALSYMHND